MLLLEQYNTTKGRVNKKIISKVERKLKARDNKKYEVKGIVHSAVYGHKAEDQLPGLYYLVLWKSFPKDENT